jgi:hypothetical protein
MPLLRRRVPPQPQRNPPPAPVNRLSTSTILPTGFSVIPPRVPPRNPTVHSTILTVRPITSVPRTVVPTAVTRTIVRPNPTVVIPPPVVPPQHGRHHRRSADVPPNPAVPVVRGHGGGHGRVRVPRH